MVPRTSQLSRKNHYVPRSYLKRWAVTKNRLSVHRLLVSHSRVPEWKSASVAGIAYHSHLYTRIVAGEETDEFEHWIDREFESPAEPVVRRAVGDSRLSKEDWAVLVRYLAAQDVRTPARLLEMLRRWKSGSLNDLLEKAIKNSVSRIESQVASGRIPTVRKEPNSEMFPARVSRESVPGQAGGVLKVETVVGRGLWLFAMKHLLTERIKSLHKQRWTILRSPPNITWLTSDNPVVKLNYHSANEYDFGGGWGSRGTEIFFPLGPHHMMFTQIEYKPQPRGSVVTPELADFFQRCTIENAHRYVFADSPYERVARIRPRIVSAQRFAEEESQWGRWHQDQSEGERSVDRD